MRGIVAWLGLSCLVCVCSAAVPPASLSGMTNEEYRAYYNNYVEFGGPQLQEHQDKRAKARVDKAKADATRQGEKRAVVGETVHMVGVQAAKEQVGAKEARFCDAVSKNRDETCQLLGT